MANENSPNSNDQNGSGDHQDLDDLEERLRKVQGNRKTTSSESTSMNRGMPPSNALGLALRIGTELVVAVLVGTGMGWFLDRWLDTGPWLMIVCFFLGTAAGITNVIRVGTNWQPPTNDDE